ncbi:MAG TPA: HAMP domain-containing sensor histidine kinase [Pirellulaceae bacterium]|jgi:hypothetical protein|nr:HAMP domain-containing sensor histidine kinase [Pirellulaceae bacterium]
MRLADFILTNIELILVEWEAFARDIWQGSTPDPTTLRDHAEAILRATAADMRSYQTSVQQSEKSKGLADDATGARRMAQASVEHGIGRLRSGFDLLSLLSEYRALRASVVRLWTESRPAPDRNDLEDLTRFHESIDHSIAESAASFAENGERSRQMFLGILGHDLRNPLNSIMVSAQLLSLDENLSGDSQGATRQIAASVDAMAGIIHDLLDFATTRLGGSMPIAPKPMDLTGICREVVAEMRAGHPARTIDLNTPDDLTLEADASRLRQALSNLIGNAIQHGARSSPIAVNVRREDESVVLSVTNAGTAIPPEAFGTIFDPFIQGTSGDETVRAQSSSVGLGLYIVREIVTAHRGEIDVESSTEGGTTFAIRLPLHPSAVLG